MNQHIAKSSLSAPRRRLVEAMQHINFGKIEIQLRDAEPLFEPPPRIIQEVKIGSQNEPQQPPTGSDFLLKSQVVELLRHLERIGTGKIAIEVRYGLPARIIFERPSVNA